MGLDFDRAFDLQLRNFRDSIRTGDADSETLLKHIDDVQRQVKENLSGISSHDREKYDMQLQRAREEVWKLKKPKRFQFKFSKPPVANKEPQIRLDAIQAPSLDARSIHKTDAATTRRTVIFEPDQQANFSCSDLAGSVLIASNVTGSVYLTRVSRSKVIIKCSQCRIHECADIDVHLEGCKNPIIEDSSRVRFTTSDSQDVRVSDFSWMRSEPSPNYSLGPLTSSQHACVSSYTRRDAEELKASLGTIIDRK